MYGLSRCQISATRAGRAVACYSAHKVHQTVQLRQHQNTPLIDCKGVIGLPVGLKSKRASRSGSSFLKEGAMVGEEVGEPQHAISHVIFDMDGLLLNTEYEYTTMQHAILTRYGRKYVWMLKSKMMGKKSIEVGQLVVHDLGLKGIVTPEEFTAEQESMLDSIFPNVDLLPGVEQLVQHLQSHEVPICVAMSSDRRLFNVKITKHRELFLLMHHVVISDDPIVKVSKPCPNIFIAALEMFNEPHLTPEHALVFEDLPGGVGAAINAKMHVVMVPDKNLDPKLQEGASQVIFSLWDFDPG